MKKFFKLIPIFLTAIVLAVFFVPSFASTARADTNNLPYYTATAKQSRTLKDQEMFLQYAGRVLVGVDITGSVWRSESGTVSDLTKTGVNLSYTTKLPKQLYVEGYNNVSTDFTTQVSNLLAYGNGILLFIGNDGTNTVAYKSIDQGKTWTMHPTGITNKTTSTGIFQNEYALDLQYGNDMFVLITVKGEGSDIKQFNKGKVLRTSATGEIWQTKELDIVPSTINYGNGYFTSSYYSNGNICFRHTKTFNSWETSLKTIPATAQSLEEYFLTAVTKIGNIFFAITPEGRTFICTGTNQAWRELNTLDGVERIEKIYPYENGVIATSAYTEEIYYLEVSETEVTAKIMYRSSDNMTSIRPECANTVAICDKFVTVGGSDIYLNSTVKELSSTGSHFTTYTRSVSHRVEFRDYNGTLIASADVVEGNTVVAPANPIRTGYTFIGWDKDITSPITEETVFTAVYEVNNYTVTFKLDDGTILATLEVPYNTQVPEDKIPVPTKDRHQFTGWDKDVRALITGDTTFVAQFSQYAYLTFQLPWKDGTFGLVNQFIKTAIKTATIRYTIGDIIETDSEYISLMHDFEAWTKDFELDGKWDWDVKFLGWDKTLPTHINEDITVTAKYEKLNLVRLVYYSQLRFKIEDDYYNTYIAEMNIERLVENGSKINLDDFKRADVDYEIYNANRDAFYNNLVGFNFTGWDKDITAPITEDTIIKGQYKMPTFKIRYYDADLYMFEETNNEIEFLGIENLLEILRRDTSFVKSYKRIFGTCIFSNLGKSIEKLLERLDVYTYIDGLRQYNDKSTRLITPFVVIDSDRPDAYGGIFTNGKITVDSAVLEPFAGDLQQHDKSYYISPIMFTTNAYPMSATVTFTNKLHSAIKTFNTFFGAIGSFFTRAWKWLSKVLIILAVIAVVCFILYLFKEPLRRAINNASKRREAQKRENQKTKQEYKNSKKK